MITYKVNNKKNYMTVAGYIKSIKRLLPLRTHLQLVVLIYNSLPPICLNSSFFSSVCYEVLYKRIKNSRYL